VDVESSEREALAHYLFVRTEEAFARLFESLYPRFYRYFRGHGFAHGTAEELSQNVLVAVHRSVESLRDAGAFIPWAYRIARNEALQERRRLHSASRSAELVDFDERTVAARRDEGGGAGFLAEWKDSLDGIEKEILVLRFVEGMEYHEIAEALGMPLGTVKWRIFQTKRKIAAAMGAVAGARRRW